MKKIKPMTLKAQYFPPSPSENLEEVSEDLRRPLAADLKRRLVKFGWGSVLAGLFIVWIAFYLSKDLAEQMVVLSRVIVVLATAIYLMVGLPAIITSKIQKARAFCRLCDSHLVFKSMKTGNVVQTRAICERCQKFSIETRFSTEKYTGVQKLRPNGLTILNRGEPKHDPETNGQHGDRRRVPGPGDRFFYGTGDAS